MPFLKYLFIILISYSTPLYAARVVNVIEYGAVPNSFIDATASVKKAIAACNPDDQTTLVFPKGRYDFWPSAADERNYFISNTSTEQESPSKLKRIGLLFENKKNIAIDGNGSLFTFHGKMITWTFDHCSDILLQNIEVDFERPSMSEMTLEEISDSSITASVHPDSKFTIINDTLQWYGEGWGMHNHFAILVNPADSTFTYSSWKPFSQSKATMLANGHVQFKGNFKFAAYRKGAVLTIRDPIRDHVGMFINLSKSVSLANVSMHYMHGLGIISQFSENLSFDHIQVVPSHNRMIAAFADCLHFSGCRGYINIQNCHFKGSHDDPVNVHGTQLRIVENGPGHSVKLRFMHGQSYGFPAYFTGDTVNFVHSATLQTYASGIVKEARLISEREMMVSFTTPLPTGFQKDDCIENISWTPALTVRDCLFEATNTRGLLVTTPRKVIIENNTFNKTGMQAILIADDASSWFESGPVNDVTITRNKFINCGYNLGKNNYTIAIEPENHTLVKNFYVHHNIRIVDNNFITNGMALLSARSTEHLTFTGNIISRSDSVSVTEKESQIRFTACDNVTVKDNRFLNSQPVVHVLSMPLKSVSSDVKKIDH